MSYYRTFNPPSDIVDKLRQKTRKSSFAINTKNPRIELRTYCMLDHSEHKINDIIEHIRYMLSSINYDVVIDSYMYAVNRYDENDEHEIWFCGWQYSKNEPDTTIEEITDDTVSKLVMLCYAIKTPDWFESYEKFYEKEKEIDSTIEYFIDIASLNADFEIIKMLKEWETGDSDKYERLRKEMVEQKQEEQPHDEEIRISENDTISLSCANTLNEETTEYTDGVH